MRLPFEIWRLIFGSLDKRYLSNVRLVCKSFEEAASPFVFNEVYVSYTRAELEIANLTVRRFGQYIRTLIFSPTYLVYTLDNFHAGISWRSNLLDIEPSECFNQHLEHAWNRYSGQRDEWREVDESGELVGHLCFLLGKMPRFQTIKITACPIFRCTSRESLKLSEPKLVCPEPGCKLHKNFFDVGPGIGCLTNGKRAWHSLMLALSITKSCVKNLISDHSCGEWPICCNVLDMSQARAVQFGESFGRLIKLRLDLNEYDDEARSSTSDGYTQGNLAKILASATNLEQLQLEFQDEDKEPRFERILGDCKFPKLKSLELSYIKSTEEEIVSFLGSSPGLENLKLHYHYLRLGLWEHVAHRIKKFLQLSSVTLDVMGGEIEAFEEDDWAFMMSDQFVDNFFLRNGKNPFTKDALELRKDAKRVL